MDSSFSSRSRGQLLNYKELLNPQQYAAVTSETGPALVLAGAGSGKTRTLTYRLAYLLDQGVSPESILLQTFTNKAAKEMVERIERWLPFDPSRLWSGTFHSIGVRFLRRHGASLGLTSNLSILDREDCKTLLKQVTEEAKVDSSALKFPKPNVLLDCFSLAANTQKTIELVARENYGLDEELIDPLKQIHAYYLKRKQEANAVDFDDLLTLPLQLMQENPSILARYQEQFQFVLVDEYQDTNIVQAKMIDLLVQEHQSIMAVGDDAQSIYSWRGANPENILGFPQRYPQAKVYRIETNYRSTPEILGLANEVIDQNTRKFEKHLKAARDSGKSPIQALLSNPSAQADFVCDHILELQDSGTELNQIAVLYRSHFHATEIQLELTKRGIPYFISSGVRFFEQAHIKDVLAFLRLVQNPLDEISFRRIALMFPGIGEKSAVKMWRIWQLSMQKGTSKPVEFVRAFAQLSVPKKAAPAWLQLQHTIAEFCDKEGNWVAPEAMITSVLFGVYEEYAQGQFSNWENRLRELEQLTEIAQQSENLGEFLEQSSLQGGTEMGLTEATKDVAMVQLSTIHQAKGLEFDAVFTIWLTEGMFPSKQSLTQEALGNIQAIEEERRLFYVACTRAKNQLYLSTLASWPNAWNGEFYQRPSRFLRDFSANKVIAWED